MRFFNKITLQTPESVELEFTLAGIGNRTQALLVDYLFLGGAIALVLFTGAVLFPQFSTATQKWYVAIAILLTFGMFVGY
jgi:uncharacterized RDD family membrane protein YckC